jgi:hypothetical protein
VGLEPSFAEAFFHRLPHSFDERDPWSEHRVLGLRLRPFSLWHQFLLSAADSPLLQSESEIELTDLARAVSICRCRYHQSDFGVGMRLRSWWSVAGKGGFAKELSAFRDYIRDFQSSPEYSIIPPDHAAPSTPRGQPPELLKIVDDVMHEARCSRRAAWEMPEGEARWWHAMALRRKGVDLNFMTPEERARQAGIEQEDPELYAQMLAVAEQFEKGVW